LSIPTSSLSVLIYPQSHARPATVLRDELDASVFEGAADGVEGRVDWRPPPAFKIGNRPFCHPGSLRKLFARNFEHRAGRAALGSIHLATLPELGILKSGNPAI
jgi:hypothetical protein